MQETYHIEKNTVQETLVIPLYGRKYAMELYPDLFQDHASRKLCERLDYAYDSKYGIKERIGAIMAATRQYDMACVCRTYLEEHPNACVVNLGCGLDDTFAQVDNGTAKSYCVDMPDVIEIRRELLPPKERETFIPTDLNDVSWFDQVDFQKENGAVFFASGVFFYFLKEDVKKLFAAMAERFPGGKLVFDATNEKGIRSMQKTWLNAADIKVGTYFFLNDAETEVKTYSDHIAKVTKKGYSTGYRDLDKRYGFIANTIMRFGDRSNSSQVIEVDFA